ncbi:MAG: NADPH:quinone oxidoreductase family protein [Acidimicrobiales bacterium]
MSDRSEVTLSFQPSTGLARAGTEELRHDEAHCSGPDPLMRAWQVQGAGEPIDVLHLVELEPPQPEPGQVRIRIEAAGIGLPDVLMCRGTYPLTPPLPFTPGQEATGSITATGDGVDLPIGTRLMCVTAFTEGSGSFAEECLVPVSSAFAVPDGLTDPEAAGFWISHLTGWIGLVDLGGVARGEWLAVLGAAGGSGIAAVQLGRALGAQVVAVVSDEARASFCRKLGADATINHTEGPVAPALRTITGGRGVDLIFDPVGGSIAEDAAAALGRRGRLLAVGFASGQWPKLATLDLVVTNTSLVGVFAGGYTRHELDDIHANLSRLVSTGQLTNAVTAEVSFDELPEALQRVADRRVVGKLVMVP